MIRIHVCQICNWLIWEMNAGCKFSSTKIHDPFQVFPNGPCELCVLYYQTKLNYNSQEVSWFCRFQIKQNKWTNEWIVKWENGHFEYHILIFFCELRILASFKVLLVAGTHKKIIPLFISCSFFMKYCCTSSSCSLCSSNLTDSSSTFLTFPLIPPSFRHFSRSWSSLALNNSDAWSIAVSCSYKKEWKINLFFLIKYNNILNLSS